MRKSIYIAFGLALFVSMSVGGASVARAASLTEAQISAVLTLMSAFGVDAATSKNVEAALRGAPSGTAPNTLVCNKVPQRDLYLGLSDLTKNGDVTMLQSFLMDEGYFSGEITGYFGPITKSALDHWQKASGLVIAPTGQGTFGAKSRVLMAAKKCNKVPNMSAITGPTALMVSQGGVWNVEATDSENDPLHFVVRWGDEPSPVDVTYPFNWPALGFASEYRGTTTFAHAYSKAGTYKMIVAVTDDRDVNNVAEKTLTIIVR